MESSTRTSATVLKTLSSVPPWVSTLQNPTAAPAGSSAKAATCHKFQVSLNLRGRRSLVVIGVSIS
jgi:hypothetical protein